MLESGENYLETILVLHNTTGFVRAIDIANHLSYTKPSVSRALGILKKDNYIEVLHSGQIILTEKGNTKANDIYARHRYISQFLVSTLGLDAEIADKDACRIEHVISDCTVEKIKLFLADADTDK